MGKSVETIVCINKDLFNKLLLITNNTSDLCLDENETEYLIEKSIYDDVVINFNKRFKEIERELPLNTKGVSLSRYNELNDKYKEVEYNHIRNGFNKIKDKKINEEEQLSLKVEIFEEIKDLKQIPDLINRIKLELQEIKQNHLSDNIGSYITRYNTLLRDGGLL